ncbi:MAG TPA: hypothetical protein VE421_09625 [Burkholderiaceae bacterium]|nr:hypothetical protein [Burkholderiaceae bacterium]
MKQTRLFFFIAALALTGCATSLGPSDNFNDWTNSATYHHYQQPRTAVANVAPYVDSEEARKE